MSLIVSDCFSTGLLVERLDPSPPTLPGPFINGGDKLQVICVVGKICTNQDN